MKTLVFIGAVAVLSWDFAVVDCIVAGAPKLLNMWSNTQNFAMAGASMLLMPLLAAIGWVLWNVGRGIFAAIWKDLSEILG